MKPVTQPIRRPPSRDEAGKATIETTEADYVVAANEKRRHLTKAQLSCAAVKYKEYTDKEAKERQRQAGEQFGRGKRKVQERVPEAIPRAQCRDETGPTASRLLVTM